MTPKPSLSAVVITFNEERNIGRCLGSLRWADEIIVVDSFSTDRTVELARKLGAKVLQHDYDGDIVQRQRGFAVATGSWLLYADADEEVSEALRDEILRTIRDPRAFDGYLIPRKVWALGRWIEHGGWSPDYSLRLFRRDAAIPLPAEVHGGFTVNGESGTLGGALYHYTYASIHDYLAKMNDYTSLQISSKLKEPSPPFPAMKVLFSPLFHFIRRYITTKGYKDGIEGFVLACLSAIYTLGLYAKLWEYRMREREGRHELPPVTNLDLRRLKRA